MAGVKGEPGMTSLDQMVVVDGVRYRPEDAPKKTEPADEVDAVSTKQAQPRNKARQAPTK